ncbi:alpha-ketoacid dehydrogenase subunit alpha/beta [Haliscomenobacter hydrossis]|uniref:3-methyl-2-oxobutanoate dehydrogenase (2-methylpropanoyl-transferring) n=1 Tax=Haliscomenobacter hydrossis (strain ATCC 27775 / DSM 1100 / LMG 10767 / O) TaxID=760192 RepID=F4KRB7_HALH1|nr:alpha-ketoacid dehydrogenase subunit alpha/beta [Haliscomenobacter hydrossis]AEE54304.1 Transketolase central region [Haliscomenobacter hydrossis DSM 1100]
MVGDLKKNQAAQVLADAKFDRDEVLEDFRICCVSREVSLMARKEVLTGKAKFAVTGDGKEVPQVAMAKAFLKGDYRAGYYRDQTWMFALGIVSLEDYFAQLYADTENDPYSGGRQMNNHFATPIVDPYTGEWANQLEQYNVSADVSCTAGQMARALGFAFASKKYRESETLSEGTPFSHRGNEVCFSTIGDASTSEGIFWEVINAAGVLQVPLVISVWDDGYGISVPVEYQTTKGSISKALKGFEPDENGQGVTIYAEKAWRYPELVALYQRVIQDARVNHQPALIHIEEVTQPQGHSTSGSHERYKSKERLQWERDFDCILQMEQWMILEGLATPDEIRQIKDKARKTVKDARDRAWKAYSAPTAQVRKQLEAIYRDMLNEHPKVVALLKAEETLIAPVISELLQNARRVLYNTLGEDSLARQSLVQWVKEIEALAHQRYHTHLYSETPNSALKVPVVSAKYSEDSPIKNGFEILNAYFDTVIENDPRIFGFGEDVGKIGDVNQGFAGLQAKHGENRVFDTGIREWSIMGQAIGMSMRGLRPIAEIQYLDYLLYGLEPLSDDVACLRYRTNGIQTAPLIVRTRGHRLEGIWHAGSPMGMMINSLRGMCILTPRNMTQAAGMYNTLLQSDEPGIIVECLNGYRLKETLPDNIGTFTVPVGVPEVLQPGTDLSIVTYGSCVRVAQEGIKMLEKFGISVELIDVQSLLPFDVHHSIVESLKKTNRVIFMDEDVPGGASAFMMREVLEVQGGYKFLDAAPLSITAKAHRPPYGSDGDYFTKPNPEDVFETVYKMMCEGEPSRFNGLL